MSVSRTGPAKPTLPTNPTKLDDDAIKTKIKIESIEISVSTNVDGKRAKTLDETQKATPAAKAEVDPAVQQDTRARAAAGDVAQKQRVQDNGAANGANCQKKEAIGVKKGINGADGAPQVEAKTAAKANETPEKLANDLLKALESGDISKVADALAKFVQAQQGAQDKAPKAAQAAGAPQAQAAGAPQAQAAGAPQAQAAGAPQAQAAGAPQAQAAGAPQAQAAGAPQAQAAGAPQAQAAGAPQAQAPQQGVEALYPQLLQALQSGDPQKITQVLEKLLQGMMQSGIGNNQPIGVGAPGKGGALPQMAAPAGNVPGMGQPGAPGAAGPAAGAVNGMPGQPSQAQTQLLLLFALLQMLMAQAQGQNPMGQGAAGQGFKPGQGGAFPGAGIPGAGIPGAGIPGAGVPGAGVPGAGIPGAGIPGAGATAPGAVGQNPAAAANPAAIGPLNANQQGQMNNLLAAARTSSAGRQPDGQCYSHVAKFLDRVGYGNVGGGNFNNVVPPSHYAEARQFAEFANTGDNAARMGLKRLPIDNPYDAPPGALVVVRAGTPGTAHPTAGDIAVKGEGNRFYNGGEMGYGGRHNFPPGNDMVLGVYVPA